MEEAQPKTGLLYSPRQIEIATLLASPSAIYMLVKNYNVLEKDEYSRNVKYIGPLVFVLYVLTALYIPYEVPISILQGIPVFFVWAILQKYHMTKEEKYGGGIGIRTLDRLLTYASFQDWCIQPLCHPT